MSIVEYLSLIREKRKKKEKNREERKKKKIHRLQVIDEIQLLKKGKESRERVSRGVTFYTVVNHRVALILYLVRKKTALPFFLI